MDFQEIIAAKRDGREHSAEELSLLAKGAADGSIPDYQLAAWLMAAYLNPLASQETTDLTCAMADSGERMDLTGLPKPWVDKHSTGGVGDKTSLVLLPLLAACGLTIVKMSGRGLGITGGTVDKLSSIPGFRTDLSPEELKAQARQIGLALTGQTPNLAPADKALYALRDVTATVSSMPLIVSSILSKKLAGGAETIVLDVKCGSGAFMKTFEDAKHLADGLLETGTALGLNVRLAITDMDQPLGSAVGNALEVAEAIRVLTQDSALPGPTARFRKLCLDLGAHTLHASGLVQSEEEGRRLADANLLSGRAMERAKSWFAAQGATADIFENPRALPRAAVQEEMLVDAQGWLKRLDAEIVGQAVVDLGGGRKEKDDKLDLGVGVEIHAVVGDQLEVGQPLLTIHARSREELDQARLALTTAVEISPSAVPATPLILSVR